MLDKNTRAEKEREREILLYKVKYIPNTRKLVLLSWDVNFLFIYCRSRLYHTVCERGDESGLDELGLKLGPDPFLRDVAGRKFLPMDTTRSASVCLLLPLVGE